MNLESQLPLVLDLCLKSSAILLAAFAVAWIARKTSAARRHLIWLAAFITLALLPLTFAISPRWSWSLQRPAPAKSVFLNTIPVTIAKLPDSSASTVPTKPAWHFPDWSAMAGGIWLTGALLLLARQAAGFWKLRGLRRHSSPFTSGPAVEFASEFGDAEMRHSPLCTVPLTWGWRKPVVLLPESASSWPETQLRAALAHEFGHIARRDFLWRQCAQIVRAFFWPNPLVWLAVRALHRAQEEACDDLALSHGASPREYAMQLLEAARALSGATFTTTQAVAMALPSTLEGRVRAIVDEQRDRRAPGLLTHLAAASATIAVIAASAFAQVKSTPPEPSAEPQVSIDVKLIEFPEGAMEVSDLTPTLTAPGFATALKTLTAKKGVDLLSSPRVIARSGQRASIEIGNGADPKARSSKFEMLPVVNSDATAIALEFASRTTSLVGNHLSDGKPVETTRVLKTNITMPIGHTHLLFGKAAENGRATLITVTASIVGPDGPPPIKRMVPEERPSGKKIPGKPGFLTSPFAPEAGEIDVRGLPPGTEIKDPHTGKHFFVPDDEPATLERAKRIVIPRLTFKEATVSEALDFLTMKALDLDPEKKGVNLVLKPGPETGTTKITIDLRDIPFTEALKYITSLANLKFRYEGEAVVIVPSEQQAPQPMEINPFGTIHVNGINWVASDVISNDGTAKMTGKALRYDAENREFGAEMTFGKKVTGWVETGKVRAK